jgi:hypothetical protein
MVSKPKNSIALAAALAAPLLACGCNPDARTPGASMAVTVQTAPWSFAGADGTALTSDHYRIHTTTVNRGMLTYLPGFMENAHRNYLALTGLSEPSRKERMPIYLLGTRRQWAAMTERVTGPRHKLYLAIENGGYCYRGVCVFWDMGHFATFSVAAHEGLHQFLYHRLRDPLPAWAEEGLAVLAEGFEMAAASVRFTPERNTLRQANLRNMISGGRWIALEKLLSTDAADHVDGSVTGPEYYGQLWALLAYIRSQPAYRGALERMLSDAARGKLRAALNVPKAMGTGRAYNQAVSVPMFEHYIDPASAEFEKRFRAYSRKLAKLD